MWRYQAFKIDRWKGKQKYPEFIIILKNYYYLQVIDFLTPGWEIRQITLIVAFVNSKVT